ncbi:MAG TPA: hypothetical protein VGX25_28190 [Actinophytocola sp.]|uniref:hypothetical protein n=1 Tax=Actinophytocola sp. TaxID=1872138 RepID=UPI002DDDB507|nr:hypothetical protein [Actinophytocola sp.]HEV2783282.1 hypothetical protein [Actinophytocola sp.]
MIARTEDQILALRLRGFQFINPRDAGGQVLAVVGVRAHGDVIDVVRLHSEDDAVASRVPSDENILSPRRVYWQQAGPACEVLGELLALPDNALNIPAGSRA